MADLLQEKLSGIFVALGGAYGTAPPPGCKDVLGWWLDVITEQIIAGGGGGKIIPSGYYTIDTDQDLYDFISNYDHGTPDGNVILTFNNDIDGDGRNLIINAYGANFSAGGTVCLDIDGHILSDLRFFVSGLKADNGTLTGCEIYGPTFADFYNVEGDNSNIIKYGSSVVLGGGNFSPEVADGGIFTIHSGVSEYPNPLDNGGTIIDNRPDHLKDTFSRKL
jgi:hypothetical protein